MNQTEMLRLAEELRDANQLGEFMGMLGLLDPMHNCTIIPTLKEGVKGNLWIKQMDLSSQGKTHFGRPHYFPHVTVIPQGKALVETWDPGEDGKPVLGSKQAKIVEGPTILNIPSNKYHTFTALTNHKKCPTCGHNNGVIAYCAYALRDSLDAEGNVVPDWDGSKLPYAEKPIDLSLEEIEEMRKPI